MTNQDIVRAILSKDAGRVAEAKTAIKASLDARATQFRAESTKFVTKSLFEAKFERDFNGVDVGAVNHHTQKAKEHYDNAVEHKEHHAKTGEPAEEKAFHAHMKASTWHEGAAKRHSEESMYRDHNTDMSRKLSQRAAEASREAWATRRKDD